MIIFSVPNLRVSWAIIVSSAFCQKRRPQAASTHTSTVFVSKDNEAAQFRLYQNQIRANWEV